MSYCRFGEADVYVYLDSGGYLACCGCALRQRSQQFYSTDAMLYHLYEHRGAGHDVPDDVFTQLEADRAENEAFIATSTTEAELDDDIKRMEAGIDVGPY